MMKLPSKMLVSIIGSGRMGLALAEYFLEHNTKVIIISHRARFSYNGVLITNDIKKIRESNLIIECIPEELEDKKTILKSIEKNCNQNAIIASNTSSFSLNLLSESLKYPKRFLGLHFFYPIKSSKIVEIVPSKHTNKETIKKAKTFLESVGIEGVVVKDSLGFVVNRLLFRMLGESIEIIKEGVCSTEELDILTKKALKWPLGPSELIDFIGPELTSKLIRRIYDRKE